MRNQPLRHDRRVGGGGEDQLVLRLAPAAADAAGPRHRRGDPGWAAAGGVDAAGADGTVSGGVGEATFNHSAWPSQIWDLTAPRRRRNGR